MKTWSSGEILLASDLNNEFNNLLTNARDLISPLTGSLDMDGRELILDGDADSSLTADTDDRLDVRLGGVDLFRFDGQTASCVNGLDFFGVITGARPRLVAVGSDTNIGVAIRPKGTATVASVVIEDGNGNEVLIGDIATASAVNEVTVTNAATGSGPILAASGGDTNIPITLKGKGTGHVILGTATSTDVRHAADQPITDSSGNELIKFTKAATAVNEITVDNAATGGKPVIKASGETNVTLALRGKGTGEVINQDPSGNNVGWVPLSYMAGLTYANNAGDATNDIDIAAGLCRDSTDARNIRLTATITKQLDAAWAVGSAAGGLDTGAIGNSDYYIWLITRSDTNIVDALFSLSSTAPTMPTNYDYKRLIGWFKRVGAAIVAFHTYETEGGGLEMNWDSPTLDINLANTLTTARRTDAVKVPLNFSTEAHLNVVFKDASANTLGWIYCPDQTDLAPSISAAPLNNLYTPVAGGNTGFQIRVRTSSTGTVAARADTATIDVYAAVTIGFKWARRA